MTLEKPTPLATEVRDGMRIDWDVPIVMDDGVVLRADVYRPVEDGAYPVIASYGVYGKNLPFQAEPYTKLWEAMIEKYPDVARGSTNAYQAWEVVDPEKWVPHGYAVLRIDSRGAGRSEGRLDCFSAREARDLHDCIEWAAAQQWSNGKVGLSGISYYAVNQWHVAALHPPHLAAICPWEGFADWYRDLARHGGIHTTFMARWYPVQATTVQHGLGTRGPRKPHNGMLVAGDVELSDEELEANRVDLGAELRAHEFDDDYSRARTPDWEAITTPLLSAANWGGHALHNRGNFMGYMHAASQHKWLEVHGGEHWTLYYTDYGVDLQRRFFDCFLKGEGDWLQTQPPVLLHVRHPGERFVERAEEEWPLARTRWTETYLDPGAGRLSLERPAAESSATYRASGEGLTLLLDPFEEDTEITGPIGCKLWISASTEDADLFLVVRLWHPEGDEVLFQGANEPRAPIAQGWLRASHRRLDEARSKPWQPFHPHQEREPLEPGRLYELDIEIWPTCIVAPAGYRLGLSILGRDFDHGLEGTMSHLGVEMRGSGFWMHDDETQRPPSIYDNEVTVYGGGDHSSYVLLPIIPEKR